MEPFRDFTTYLSKYKTTRENILSDKQTVSVASRIIDDNFTFYAKNIQRFQGLPDSVKEELNTQLSSLSDKEINCFDPTKYSSFTNQAGIDLYNKFIGGVAENERNKTKGLNELLNEAYQQKRIPRKIAFAPLYKQIMTERQTFSFIAEPYKNDEDVLAAIKAYSEALNMHVHYKAEEIENVLESQSDLGGIYIQEKKVKELASILFSNWRLFNDIKLKKGSVTALQELQSKSDEIFYVPAAFTSKIDPITGFVNLFRSEFLNYSSVKAAKDFIGRFESIRYDKEMNCFAFAFNYKDFEVNADYTDRWTVCTVGDDRIAHTIKDGRHEYTTVNVTEELEQLFASNGISPF